MQVLTTAPSPHRYAARYNQLELFIELLERHANLNSYDAKRRTALHAAVKHRHHTIVRLLLRAGASVNVPTLDGAMTTPLHLAAMSGNLEIARLLLEAHADPALTNSDGENTAGVAAGHVEVQRLLYASPPAPRQGAHHGALSVTAAARASSGNCMRVLTTAPCLLPQVHASRR
jgi:ankyrin repeat protein